MVRRWGPDLHLVLVWGLVRKAGAEVSAEVEIGERGVCRAVVRDQRVDRMVEAGMH